MEIFRSVRHPQATQNQPQQERDCFTRNFKPMSPRWVEAMERFWLRMASNYGFDRWDWRYGQADLNNPAFEEWAQRLMRVEPKATAEALECLPKEIPTLGEFVKLARSFEKAKPLVHPSPEELKAQFAAQERLAKKIKSDMEKPKQKVIGRSRREEMLRTLCARWPETRWEESAFGAWLNEQEQLEKSQVQGGAQ